MASVADEEERRSKDHQAHDVRCGLDLRARILFAYGDPAEPPKALLQTVAAAIVEHCNHRPLKALRLAYGWTVATAVAEVHALCTRSRLRQRGLTERSWKEWEAGGGVSDDYRDLLCRLFQTGPVQLGFAKDYTLAPPANIPALGVADHVVPDDADRSAWLASRSEPGEVADLLGHVHALAIACGFTVRAARTSRRHVALSDVTRLGAIADLYRSIDRERGGTQLYEDLSMLAEAATSWLDPQEASVDPAARSRLAVVIADVRLLAGWTAFDSGSYEDSQRHFVLAERAAARANDARLVARVRYCQARQLQHRHHNGDALHTIRYAIDDVGPQATPALSALLLGTEAASLAALGHTEDALQCLARATEAFGAIAPGAEPAWMDFYNAGELFAQYSRVYRDLARHARTERRSGVFTVDAEYGVQAVYWVRQALDSFGAGNGRSIVLNQVSLCSALALADDLDGAIVAGRAVLSAARGLSSQRVTERVANLRRDFNPHLHRAEAREFAHVLPIAG